MTTATYTPSTFALREDPTSIIEAVRLAADDDDPEQEQDWMALAAWAGSDVVNHEIADSGEYASSIPLSNGHAQTGDWVVRLGDRFERWTNAEFVGAVVDPPARAVRDAAQHLFEEGGWEVFGRAADTPEGQQDCSGAQATPPCGCANCVMLRWIDDAVVQFADFERRALSGDR